MTEAKKWSNPEEYKVYMESLGITDTFEEYLEKQKQKLIAEIGIDAYNQRNAFRNGIYEQLYNLDKPWSPPRTNSLIEKAKKIARRLKVF